MFAFTYTQYERLRLSASSFFSSDHDTDYLITLKIQTDSNTLPEKFHVGTRRDLNVMACRRVFIGFPTAGTSTIGVEYSSARQLKGSAVNSDEKQTLVL